MQAAEFPEQNMVIAKDQPQYLPIPAHLVPGDPDGTMVFCWKLSFAERLALLFGGVIWHRVMTFGIPLQPQSLSLEKPPMTAPPKCDHCDSAATVIGADGRLSCDQCP